jgi:DNA-binding XRE family transcriptional regulator
MTMTEKSKQKIPVGFVDGDAVLDEILAEPGMTAAVDNIDRGVAEMNRIYAQGLAEIRKFAAQTQTDLAERMGIKQAAVSRIEGRDDLLLSTLAEYAAAAGAVNGRIVFQINGVDIELSLDSFHAKSP